MNIRMVAIRLAGSAEARKIIEMLESGNLTRRDCDAISATLSMVRSRVREQETADIAKAAPEELLPDKWGCYDTEETSKAVAELNELGIKLVNAIRSGTRIQIKTAIQQILQAQTKWARCGAADTEGMSALWSLFSKACVGTDYDPETLWDSVL